jgi:large subunit ribosomal protein L10
MDNPRAEKVAVVDEVRERLSGADASVVTEYRGLSVTEMADLRRSLAAAGGDYKIFKNTLVRLAVAGSPHEPIRDLLTGPTAIAFVHGDVSAVAKALRDFGRGSPHLVIKGGILDGGVLSPAQLAVLAELPSREALLAQIAGAIAAPLTQMAGLLNALPQNLAYGISAVVEQRRASEPAPEPASVRAEPGPEAAPEAGTPEAGIPEAVAPETGGPPEATADTAASGADTAAPGPDAAAVGAAQAPESGASDAEAPAGEAPEPGPAEDPGA